MKGTGLLNKHDSSIFPIHQTNCNGYQAEMWASLLASFSACIQDGDHLGRFTVEAAVFTPISQPSRPPIFFSTIQNNGNSASKSRGCFYVRLKYFATCCGCRLAFKKVEKQKFIPHPSGDHSDRGIFRCFHNHGEIFFVYVKACRIFVLQN
jgi:hypothetical protein